MRDPDGGETWVLDHPISDRASRKSGGGEGVRILTNRSNRVPFDPPKP